MADTYRPGQCNIDRTERRRRLAVGVAGFLGAVALAAGTLAVGWPSAALLLTALPLFGGFLGLFQYRRAFCAGFARRGIYDVGGERGSVTAEDARAADLTAARRLVRDAALSATALAVVAAVLAAVGR